MKAIYKYPLKITDGLQLELPKDSVVLSVAEQDSHIVLYALVDTVEKEKETHLIRIVSTGHPLPENFLLEFSFIGTVKMMNGQLMFHVFKK